MSDICSWSRPPRSQNVTRPRSRTSVPSVIRTPPPASVSRALTRRRARSNSTTGRLATGGRDMRDTSLPGAGSTRSNQTVPPRRPGLRLRITPRTHTSSGNAPRRLAPIASPSSGTENVGCAGSSHNIGGAGGLRCLAIPTDPTHEV